jgi:glycosyltransferase involved in cell wall biosynthesis
MSDFLTLLVQAGSEPTSAETTHENNDGPSDRLIRLSQLAFLAETGLFDLEYYTSNYPDVAQTQISVFEHFFDYGYLEGRRPNPYFDTAWYLSENEDVRASGRQPLLHYALYGDKDGLAPSAVFNSAWYRKHYNLKDDELALSHFLRNRKSGNYSPNPDFDIEYYLKHNPDVAAAPEIDPFEHFWLWGYRETRNPSAAFDVKFYADRYLNGDLSENPFLHYLRHRGEAGIHGRMLDDEVTLHRELKRFAKPGSHFEEHRPLPRSAHRHAKVLAYYLPQFHLFPENELWWGKGFTEWTNIARGSSRFKGHYQPRIPRDLGFYTLDNNEIMRRQAKLAQESGVFGFVFYYYWFNGKRLMEQPVDRFLNDAENDMPFCLMWANENWTRRWDGAESDVLISQDYLADDDERMVAEFSRHFRDPRYIRIAERPLLMIYRPQLIPDAASTILRWRAMFRAQFGENPIIIMAQSFGDTDPTAFALDGAIEFPPHKLTQHLKPVNLEIDLLDPEFSGKVYHYDQVVETSLGEAAPAYPLIKTAVPSWDNDARRQGHGLVINGSTPQKYEDWIAQLIQRSKRQLFFGEPIICINAWNEWCEGAYLEPDLHFGSAYLNATARAVIGASRGISVPRLVLIGHDAFPGGAQMLLLNIGKTLRRSFGVDIHFILLAGGKLEEAYRAVGPLSVCTSDGAVSARLKSLVESGFTNAIINTSAAASVVGCARAAEMDPVVLVHELPRIMREKHLVAGARAALDEARYIVFPSPFVRDEVLRELGSGMTDRILVQPQGLYRGMTRRPELGQSIREELGLREGDKLVIGAGYADLRKGFDLFLQLWRHLRSASETTGIHVAWVGAIDPALAEWLSLEISDAIATGSFHQMGYREDMEAIFSAADAFALTSREDPFPSVVLEAISMGIPVAAFDRSGGIPDMLRDLRNGDVVAHGDVVALATAILAALAVEPTEEMRSDRRAAVSRQFGFGPYVQRLLTLVAPGLHSLSVAVPNYNYSRYLPDRLSSIFNQSYPVHEVLILDDHSSDDSLTVILQIAGEWDREIRVIENEANSGSVFSQWRKAAEETTGEYIWIAEADDLSDKDFVARLLGLLNSDPTICFAFSDSRSVKADGSAQWADYKAYYATVEPSALANTEIFDASEFVERMLSVKNLILNASAVVWRRDALLRALASCQAELLAFKMAGDWRLYLEALSFPGARVAYEALPLNVHRRHGDSVTHALDADRHVREIASCHQFANKKFNLPLQVRKAQGSYLSEVSRQLEAPKATPVPRRRRSARWLAKRG